MLTCEPIDKGDQSSESPPDDSEGYLAAYLSSLALV